MSIHNFIFSRAVLYHWLRHIVFWIFWYFISLIIFLYSIEGLSFSRLLIIESADVVFKMLTEAFFFYSTIYFLIPKFFNKEKYLTFALGLIGIFTVSYWLTLLTYGFVFKYISALEDISFQRVDVTQWEVNIPYSASFFITFFKVPVATVIGLCINHFRNWYIKHKENQILKRENILAELQLLKAQVHPHFLFNTLNNIYAFALYGSSKAAELVLKLSDTMSYMINDCKAEMVTLKQELKMIQDYMALEKVRYGNRLDIEVNVTGDYTDKMITPLLLIPFVENAFKHGASKMLNNPWIKINIEIKQNSLYFSIINNKPVADHNSDNKKGIGLTNVKKRLQLLYPDSHYLQVDSTKDTFIVEMQVPLYDSQLKENEIIIKEFIPVPA